MKPPVLGFFPPLAGVGSSFLAYHLAWMYAELGLSVVVADLDPMAELSKMFLEDERLGPFWSERESSATVAAALQSSIAGKSEAADVHLEEVRDESSALSSRLLVGDLLLSSFEDELSAAWRRLREGEPGAIAGVSVFRSVFEGALRAGGDLLIVDLGPGLGVLNRSIWVALDYMVLPVSLDYLSTPALRRMGPILQSWEEEWMRGTSGSPPTLADMVGYVVLRSPLRLDLPGAFYEHSLHLLSREYWRSVQGTPLTREMELEADPACLGILKPYHHLISLARDARKPIFLLKPADGAVGSHAQSAQDAYQDFARLAQGIAARIGLKSLGHL